MSPADLNKAWAGLIVREMVNDHDVAYEIAVNDVPGIAMPPMSTPPEKAFSDRDVKLFAAHLVKRAFKGLSEGTPEERTHALLWRYGKSHLDKRTVESTIQGMSHQLLKALQKGHRSWQKGA